MYIVAFDFETYLIAPGRPFPPAVCMSYVVERDGETSSGVVQWEEGLRMLYTAGAAGAYFVGAETAFDVMVAAYNSPDVEAAARWWIAVTGAARVTDVLLRQRLLDGALDDRHRAMRYNLASVTARWTGVELDKGKDNPEHWRLRYAELDGVPIDQYPAEAYDYALQDAWYTYLVFKAQEQARHGVVGYDGHNYREHFPSSDPLVDEHRQTMKALAIKDLAATGLRTNPQTVAKFKRWLRDEVDSLRPRLVEHGLVRTEYKLRPEAVAARFASLGVSLPRTARGTPSLTKSLYAQIGDRDPHLALTQRIRGEYSWPDSAPFLAAVAPDLVCVEHARDTGRVELALTLIYMYSDEEPNLTPSGYVKTDADNCARSGHPVLKDYARYSSLSKTLGSDIDLLERASREPFHAHYTTLKANGRTATGSDGGEGSVGNVQNQPRLPGVRECYEAPGGWVFAEADFTAAELSTFGQIALWYIGWSECARMIQHGIDQHAVAGAALLNMPDPKGSGWRALKQAIAAGDSSAEDARTGGKGMNFGRKAKMSAKRYKTYAWNNYGLKLTEPEAERHIRLHDELIQEMGPYSAWCETFARNPGQFGGRYDLVHPWSGRCRADVGYTDVHNYPFSGLAQDMAAVALWDLFAARWGASELGTSDPFYGSMPCLFAHDSIVALVPDDHRAPAAAERLGEIMTRAARKVLPDVGSAAEPLLTRQLSKKAKPKKDVDGRLVVWDCWDAARDDARKCPEGQSVRQYLTARKWPAYVIGDLANG